jgi:hypothetical protein
MTTSLKRTRESQFPSTVGSRRRTRLDLSQASAEERLSLRSSDFEFMGERGRSQLERTEDRVFGRKLRSGTGSPHLASQCLRGNDYQPERHDHSCDKQSPSRRLTSWADPQLVAVAKDKLPASTRRQVLPVKNPGRSEHASPLSQVAVTL